VENAISFNRKLNEERKMRIPYIDGQTGVAQRHYNSFRDKRERMPPRMEGQILAYPQKKWKKNSYQYIRYFMQPKRFDPDTEMHTISQIENPSLNEDSNQSGSAAMAAEPKAVVSGGPGRPSGRAVGGGQGGGEGGGEAGAAGKEVRHDLK
jgi:hypothetical protein